LVLSNLPAFAESGDAKRGREIFKTCVSCHEVGENAKNGIGPHLNGVFDRQAGSVEGAGYSPGLIRAGINGLQWGYDSLDVYLENPRNLVSGTRMQFRGLKDQQDRDDVIAYLREFSDNPRDIPEAAPTAAAALRDPALDGSILEIQGDSEFGEYLAGECVTCHQTSGEDEGIPSIMGWPTEVFVTAMHAYRSQARAHPVMQMIAAPLNDEEIAALAAYFSTLQP
jgi:cytochrome c